MKLLPVIKVNYQNTLNIWQGLPLDCVVVRLQDLLSSRRFKLNSTFYKIKEKGGIHSFLEFRGKVILSLVMKDKAINNFNPQRYAEVIHTLKPEFYTTVDGETYEGEEVVALKEIERCFKETAELMKLCPYSKPIGHVKGCNKSQIIYHINLLKSLGINDFILHMGDFLRNGGPKMISRAKEYAVIIRKHANNLLLYGLGSHNRLLEFSFADACITYNHFVEANYGNKYVGCKKIKYSGGYSCDIVKHNLTEMISNTNKLNSQKKLIEGGICPWAAE